MGVLPWTVMSGSLLSQLRSDGRGRPFKELASVDVGIVTGANKFFLVPDKLVKDFGLQSWAHPMFEHGAITCRVWCIREATMPQTAAMVCPRTFLWFQRGGKP